MAEVHTAHKDPLIARIEQLNPNQEIKNIIKTHLPLSEVCDIYESAGQGFMNKTYFAELNTGEKFVLRASLNRDWAPLAFAKEMYLGQILSEANLPVAMSIAAGEAETPVGLLAYHISSFLPGVDGARYVRGLEPKALEIETTKLFFQLGKIISKVNALPDKGYGITLNQDATGFQHETYKLFMEDRVQSILSEDNLIKRGILTDSQVRIFRELVQKLVESGEGKGRLCHGDLSLGNCMVNEYGEVTAIIDLGDAGNLHPITDIGSIEIVYGKAAFDSFIAGYLPEFNLQDFQAEIDAVAVVRALNWVRYGSNSPFCQLMAKRSVETLERNRHLITKGSGSFSD